MRILTAIFGLLFALSISNGFAQDAVLPLIKDLPLRKIHVEQADITIKTDDLPSKRGIQLPSFRKEKDQVLCLRFEACLHGPKPGGWNPYLGIVLNGHKLGKFTTFGEYRLLKRDEFCKNTIKENSPWWGSRDGMPVLHTFFGPGGDVLDKRVISQREEGYWYILDISDAAHFIEIGADDRIESEKPNTLTFINTFMRWMGSGAAHYPSMLIRHMEIGYLPKALVRKTRPRTLTTFKPITQGPQLALGEFHLRVSPQGGMQIKAGKDSYFLASAFSYAGEQIGYNRLAPHAAEGQPSWKPRVEKRKDGCIRVTAEGPDYCLDRVVRQDGAKMTVHDTLTNKTSQPLGIVANHSISTAEPFTKTDYRVGGTDRDAIRGGLASNPTVFISQAGSSLGVVAEDNVLRRQLEIARRGNGFDFGTHHFGIAGGEKYKMEWSLYPSSSRDYFHFVNQLRRDWNVNYTIDGPFAFSSEVLPERKAKIYAFGPWFDYHHDGSQTWSSYEKSVAPTLATLRKKQSNGIFMPMLETNLFTLVKSKIPGGEILPGSDRKTGRYGFTLDHKQSRVLEAALGEWADSVIRTDDGRIVVDTYYPGSRKTRDDLFNLMLYLKEGNKRHRHFLKQIDFLMDELGFNGIYIDQFSLSGPYGRPDCFTYDKWDGHTVDIDERGRITRKFTDCNLLGSRSRATIIERILAKGGKVVINGQSTVRETRSLPAFRFQEMDNDGVNPLVFMTEKPPICYWQAMGHLGSPIILGLRPVRFGKEGKERWAEVITKGIITGLRNGVLYYYYTSSIPSSGPGAGEYGPVNHMFPFTPVELHEGWLVGRERTITCVSGVYRWKQTRKPRVLLFDLHGREKEGGFSPARVKDGWEVAIDLDEWNEIAVME